MEGIRDSARLPDLSRARDVRSILVIRLKALGDIVLSLPIVHALRARFPDARLSYLCRPRYAEALAGVRELDEVLELPEGAIGQAAFVRSLRRRKIDCVIDLLGSPRSALITRLAGSRIRIGMDTGRRNWCYQYLLPRVVVRGGERVKCYTLESNDEIIRALGLDTLRAGRLDIGFPAAATETRWAREYLERIGGKESILIGLVPGSVYQAKSWPEEHFVELGNLLASRLGATAVILWGPGEERLAKRIAERVKGAVLTPPTGIARLGALISMLALLVGPDSGPKHLAVIQGVPTVTLFGPTDPCIWDPMTAKHRALSIGVDCFPCKKSSCEPNRCLTEISAEAVFSVVSEVLDLFPGRPTRGSEMPC